MLYSKLTMSEDKKLITICKDKPKVNLSKANAETPNKGTTIKAINKDKISFHDQQLIKNKKKFQTIQPSKNKPKATLAEKNKQHRLKFQNTQANINKAKKKKPTTQTEKNKQHRLKFEKAQANKGKPKSGKQITQTEKNKQHRLKFEKAQAHSNKLKSARQTTQAEKNEQHRLKYHANRLKLKKELDNFNNNIVKKKVVPKKKIKPIFIYSKFKYKEPIISSLQTNKKGLAGIFKIKMDRFLKKYGSIKLRLKLKKTIIKLKIKTKSAKSKLAIYPKVNLSEDINLPKGKCVLNPLNLVNSNYKIMPYILTRYTISDMTTLFTSLKYVLANTLTSYIQHKLFNNNQAINIYYIYTVINILASIKITRIIAKSFNLIRLKNRRLIVKRKKLWVLLKNKLFKLKLEKFLFSVLKVTSTVSLERINKSLGYTKRYKVPITKDFPRWLTKFFFFNELANLFFFSLYLKSTNLLAVFISRNITNNKRHFNFLKRAKLALTILFSKVRLFNLRGILISVSGKFQGHLRKRRFKLALGSAGMSTFDTIIDYDFRRSYTRWGVFSIKVFFFFYKILLIDKNEKKKIGLYYKEVYKNNPYINNKRSKLLLRLKGSDSVKDDWIT